jgi:hypothetical protein
MSGHATRRNRSRAVRLVCAGACAAALLGFTGAVARADDRPACAYALQVRALTGPAGADATLTVTPEAGCPVVETLKKVQLKTFTAGGSVDNVLNLNDVPAPGGVAQIPLGQLERGRAVEAEVLVQPEAQKETSILRARATAALRPDLVVAEVVAPPQTLTTRPIDLLAQVAELNGDTGATATVTVLWGPSVLATQSVSVPAGGRVAVTFPGLALTTPVPVELSVLLSDVSPAETDSSNNARSAHVDVTQNELARSRLLVPELGGYGAQFNQHVYAAITAAPVESLPDLEAKAKALEPQLVRIFYNDLQEAQPDALASFIRTVRLAQDAGAIINITYQTAARAKANPPLFMGRFADVIEDLVRARGDTNVRWVTVQNEPNSTNLTLAEYEALYRALDSELRTRGLRPHVGLMAGDLVEGTGDDEQRVWFQYMADHMADIVDAYSVHIYWNYWDIPRMEFRLKDVRQIVTEELPEGARKPVYITEFGVRGIRNLPGKADPPGYWEDGTQITRTNIAAFQQLWFNLESAQLGFAGAVKWDAYWGNYDKTPQSAWLIGPAAEGWPLFPTYHALRLVLQTTERGWQVLGVDPWTNDDWDRAVPDQPEQELVAYGGPNAELTLLGLDSRGRALNAVSPDVSEYSIGGLPPSTVLNLGVWNAAGNGENQIGGTVTTTVDGVARFEVPLHAAFALTTLHLS